MKKVYIASPFFNEEDIRIRDLMVEKIQTVWKDYNFFRPDLTPYSQAYSITPGDEVGQQIYDENLKYLRDSDILVFPYETKDVGTLFEIGIALKLNIKIFQYKWKDNSLTEVENSKYKLPLFYKDTLVQIETLSSAVILGYNFDSSYRIFYTLGQNIKDNVMLRFVGDKVVFKKNNIFEVNLSDIKEVN